MNKTELVAAMSELSGLTKKDSEKALMAAVTAITEELASEGPGVIISRRPCVLLKSVKPKAPLTVSETDCRGCKKCMKLGCPAIHMEGKRAVIDTTLCVGCGVCEQLCAFGAIKA